MKHIGLFKYRNENEYIGLLSLCTCNQTFRSKTINVNSSTFTDRIFNYEAQNRL